MCVCVEVFGTMCSPSSYFKLRVKRCLLLCWQGERYLHLFTKPPESSTVATSHDSAIRHTHTHVMCMINKVRAISWFQCPHLSLLDINEYRITHQASGVGQKNGFPDLSRYFVPGLKKRFY